MNLRSCVPVVLLIGLFPQLLLAQEKSELPEKTEGYQFDPNAVMRDPFEAPVMDRQGDTEEEEILRFDLKDIKIVAIMKGIGSSKVMLRLPNNRYHILHQGDTVGKNGEKIFEIQDQAVVFEKSLTDFKGSKKVQRFSKFMEEKPAGK
jgi:Tfp pilus assembly protein PilP